MISYLIKEKVHEKGYTIRQLEKTAGLKQGTVSNIMQGKSKNPSLITLQSIASALNCSLSDIIEHNSHNRLQTNECNNKLYISCVTNLIKHLEYIKSDLNRNQFIKIVDEIYIYSAKANLYEADQKFIAWILDKTTNNS